MIGNYEKCICERSTCNLFAVIFYSHLVYFCLCQPVFRLWLQKALRQACILAHVQNMSHKIQLTRSEKQPSVLTSIPAILVNGSFWTSSSEVLFHIRIQQGVASEWYVNTSLALKCCFLYVSLRMLLLFLLSTDIKISLEKSQCHSSVADAFYTAIES